MNWDVIGKLTGWLPGAAAGAVVGLLASFVLWSTLAAKTCRLGTSQIMTTCVETPVESFRSPVAFAVACMAVGGIIGAIVNAAATHLSSPAQG